MGLNSVPTTTLGELLELSDEKAFGNKDASLVYIGLEHIASGLPHLLGTAPASSATSTNSVFKEGDILFGKLRPYLRKCIQATFSGYCSTEFLVLRARGDVSPSFAAKVMQSDRIFNLADSVSFGTRMPRVSWQDLRGIEIFRPQLPEQRRIAEILDTLDDTIRKTEQLIAKLKQMKQGLLHDLLTRGIDENGELRDPERNPEQFKDSPLGLIPREWDVQPLAAFFDVKGGKRLPVGHSYSSVETRYKYLRVQDFYQQGKWDFNELECLQPATFESLSRYEIVEPNLFISIAGSIGYAGVYRASGGHSFRTVLTENAARLVQTRESIAEFVALQINEERVQQQISVELGIGGGVPKLALFRIESLLLVWPTLAEQEAIIRRVMAIESKIESELNIVAKLRTLKQGLMDDLLTGRVRVPVPEGASS